MDGWKRKHYDLKQMENKHNWNTLILMQVNFPDFFFNFCYSWCFISLSLLFSLISVIPHPSLSFSIILDTSLSGLTALRGEQDLLPQWAKVAVLTRIDSCLSSWVSAFPSLKSQAPLQPHYLTQHCKDQNYCKIICFPLMEVIQTNYCLPAQK